MVVTNTDGTKDIITNDISIDESTSRFKMLCTDRDRDGSKENLLFATQVSARKAIETFGEEGRKALVAEIDGLLRFGVFESVLVSTLSAEQRKKVIRMSCFLKEKHDSDGNLVKLKARLTCVVLSLVQ